MKTFQTLFVLSVTMSAAWGMGSGDAVCPLNDGGQTGWYAAVNLCYKIGLLRETNAGGLSYEMAHAQCASYSTATCPAKLLTVDNAPQVADNVRVKTDKQLRIDGVRHMLDPWKNFDGDLITFPGAPYTNSTTHPLTERFRNGSLYIVLADKAIHGRLHASEQKGYICQSCLELGATPVTCPLNEGTSDNPWISGNGICFRALDDKVRYHAATNLCRDLGTAACPSRLLRVKNVKPMMDTMVDLGMSLPTELYRIDGKYNNRGDLWISQYLDAIRFQGHPISFNSYQPFDSQQGYQYSLVLSIAEGKIYGNAEKTDDHKYICESCSAGGVAVKL